MIHMKTELCTLADVLGSAEFFTNELIIKELSPPLPACPETI